MAKGRISERIRSVLFLLPAWFSPHKSLRAFFHRLRGVKVGKNVEIGYFCIIGHVHPSWIELKDNATITAMSVILDHDNSRYFTGRGGVKYGKVVVEKGAFIGVHSTIMPGLTIGERAIVGANSLVVSDVEAGTTVVGVPAKVLKKRK